MSRYSKTVTVDVDVYLDDILEDIDDEDLKRYGLTRIDSAGTPDELRAALYHAAESGNCAAMLRAVEIMAWEIDGKILVARMAA